MDDLERAVLAAHLLVVDDNAVNVALLIEVLDEAGFTNVDSTTDPFQAVARVLADGVDLLLLDIRMPGKDGFQVMAEMGQAMADPPPVLVLTAQNDRDTRLKALSGGARDFVTKPFDPDEVIHRVRNLVERHLLYVERSRQAEILEAKVAERTQDLDLAHRETILRLARAGEYRDSDTGRHVERMSLYCHGLARAAGLEHDHCSALRLAAQLHDVGKIGIPDHILLKQGKLTDEERQVINTHSAIGADILSGIGASPILQMARTIAISHHEKWDGTGYPGGLAGEAIPIEGRIAAICDVFDALTMERPYKKCWTVEEAVTFLDEQAGRHFDPRLVALFLSILPDIRAIRDELQ